MSFDIRPLRESDLDPIYGWVESDPLFARYGTSRKTLAPVLTREVSDPGSVVVGAFAASGALLGFAWFVKKGAFARSGYLRLIVVDPAEKTSGVGRALMNHLESAFLRPNGIFLLATDSNRDAHAFYTRLGYRKVGEIPDYVAPGLTEWIFHRPAPTTN
jgi:ribosomal protein S18 acetylase RimI-like enzyme